MQLADEYRPGTGFFFGTADRSLLTDGHAVTLPGRGGLAPHRAHRILRALGDDQILVGAVPFDDTTPAHLVIPEQYRWGPALSPEPPGAESSRPRLSWAPDGYPEAVEQALLDIESTELSKVVLARRVCLPLPEPLPVADVLRRLRHRQTTGYVFGCELPGGRTLIGGSPELLVSRDGDTVTAHPLAGSRPRTGDPETDRRATRDLLSSNKDHREHAAVVKAIATALSPYCRELDVPAEPSVVSTSHMLHLGTRITGRLADPAPSALALAAALHPTPAVCGTPTVTARRTIARLENFDRGFYAGMIGWSDAAGNGEWAVTIRCAEATADRVRLYAGAGIVAGSSPQAELAETQAKLETMLAALGGHITGEAQVDHDLHTMA